MAEKRETEGVRKLEIIGIILTGLKIIGLTLLASLLILFVIIMLFLFVPFVYRVRVKYIAEKLSLRGEISFLFKLIYAKFLYDDKFSYDLRAAFYTPLSSEKKPEKKKTKLKKETEIKEKIKEEDTEKIDVVEQIKNEQKESEAAKVKSERAPEEKSESDIKKEAASDKKLQVNKESALEEKIPIDETSEKKENKTVKKKIKKTKKKFNIISRIKKGLETLKAKWKAFKDRFKSLNIKKDAVIKFLNADGTLSGAGYLLTQGKRLLRMIFPKKIKGWLRFGTGDVYTEGQYLSYLCLLYPLYEGKVEIEPEWDKEVLEGDMFFSGRIIMFIILLVTLKVLFSKKVKMLRNNFNRCKRNLAKS